MVSFNDFHPIPMANYKFKIISKILVDRIAPLMPFLVSSEQRGLIQGRQIKDCICLASEVANLQKYKSKNLAMKVDISKVFDTLN